MSARPVRRPAHGRLVRRRQGMTLLEVLIAVVILATVLVGLAGYLAQFTRDLNKNALRNTASDIVTNRLEFLKSVTSYAALDDFIETGAAVPGQPNFRRTTQVVRITNVATDYKRVTVTVTHPALAGESIRKSTVVARF
ncbi:MAG TPA: prepilin-type N-terminal cleavage/methylation domain-containing protein [Gemmatimonadaceae bacterium]|nr:prepilin-type N-terminal cleavage/methylation domain-containing protein [Gemmatimonadaceae bacterium]